MTDDDARRGRVVLMCPRGRTPDDARLVPPLPDWAVFLIYFLLLAAAFAVLVLPAKGAPAPVYKAPPPLHKRIEGGWEMMWGGSQGTCYLSPQGFWGAKLGGSDWHGDWSLEGKTLTIREQRIDWPDAPPVTYVITLDGEVQPRGGAVGLINGATTFILRMEGRPGR